MTFADDTLGHLRDHGMILKAYCPGCEELRCVDFGAMDETQLRKPYIGRRPRCTDCGTPGDWHVSGRQPGSNR